MRTSVHHFAKGRRCMEFASQFSARQITINPDVNDCARASFMLFSNNVNVSFFGIAIYRFHNFPETV